MGGKTHYPIDLEEEYQRYRPGKRVVFPVPTGDYTDEEPGVICDSIVDVIALPAALRHHGARQPAVVVAGTVPATATGKPQRRQLSARYGHARTLPPSAYGRLRLVAVELAHEILNSVTETHLLAGHRVRAVAKDAQRLVDRESSLEDLRAEYGREVLGSFPLGEWAARLARHPTTMGTDLSAGWMDLNLWTRMMCDDLMGEYARMAVDFLRANEIQKRSILELGSGVGNARRLLSPHLPVGDSYFPTDFLGAEEETPGRPWRFDFDSAVDWGALAAGERLRVSSGFGCVFAVNALHCSIAPAEVICRATAALAPGGLLLLGEGNPSPLDDSTPWAGDLLFSPFNGWWDRGGFRPRESWVTWMIEAGLHDIGYAVLRSGKYDLGGLVWAWKK
jgi:SAM-dependent methyltransferase